MRRSEVTDGRMVQAYIGPPGNLSASEQENEECLRKRKVGYITVQQSIVVKDKEREVNLTLLFKAE
jgi:hypothetical protein